GDRLTQKEFHRRYEAYPKEVRFELINGIVYQASPVNYPHGRSTPELCGCLGLYEMSTPGVEGLTSVTTILGPASEVHPDLILRLPPHWGGRTRVTADDYLSGGPEFIAEVAYSTCSIDMHLKKEDYRRAGVVEYFVWCLAERELHWFNF